MIKRSFTMIICMLVLVLVMYRCKNKDAEPLTPDQGLVEEINKIEVEKVKLSEPAVVPVTESKIEVSEQTTALGTAVAGMAATGVEPAGVKASASQFSSIFSKSEVSTLATVKNETINAAAAGTTLPADLTAVLAKAAANPALAMYFPKVTFPSVDGLEISGARTGSGGGSPAAPIEGTLANDECLRTAEAEFEKVKAKLDASLAEQLADADKKYNSDLKLLTDAQTICTDAIPAKYAALEKAAKDLAVQLNALVDANAATLGDDYLPMKGIISLQLISYLSVLNKLKKADIKCCTSKTTAGTKNAKTAEDLSKADIEAAYAKALEEAEKAKRELAQSCHNQGGGK